MKQRELCYSDLCLLGDPRFMTFDGTTWKLNEVVLNQFYCAIANAGAGLQRLMPWSPWLPHPYGMKSQFAPYVLVGDAFDLGKFNDYYFPITRRVIEIARSYDITTVWCLADNCQFHGAYKQWSPWVTNVNHVGSIYDPAAYVYFKKFIVRCEYEFTPLGTWWSWGNEMDHPSFLDLARETIYPMLKSDKFNPENCTYGAIMPEAPYIDGKYQSVLSATQERLKADVDKVFGEPIKLAIWREVHGCGGKGYPSFPNRLHQALSWWGRPKVDNGIRIFLSDDGTWDGDSKDDFVIYDGKMQRRPSGERWAEMITITKGFVNDFIYEHLPKNADLKVQAPVIKKMSRAVCGVDPIPKYHYDPPRPPEPPRPPDPPPPPSPPPEKPTWWQRLMHWLFGEHSWWHGWWK